MAKFGGRTSIPSGSSRYIPTLTPVIIMIFGHGMSFVPSVDPHPPFPCRPCLSNSQLHDLSFSLSPCKPDVAPTYAHPRRQQPPALSRPPPRGLGRGRVCSIDRRRSAKLAERDRAPSWRRTPRISSFACHPLFRKSSYPLLDLPSSLSSSRRITLAVPDDAPRRVLVRVSRSSQQPLPSSKESKRQRSQALRLFGIVVRDGRGIRECDGIAIESSRRKSRPPTS